MKKIIMILLVLFTSFSFANENDKVSKEKKREVFEVIQKQVDEGIIDIETAQKMWKEYVKGWKKQKEGSK